MKAALFETEAPHALVNALWIALAMLFSNLLAILRRERGEGALLRILPAPPPPRV